MKVNPLVLKFHVWVAGDSSVGMPSVSNTIKIEWEVDPLDCFDKKEYDEQKKYLIADYTRAITAIEKEWNDMPVHVVEDEQYQKDCRAEYEFEQELDELIKEAKEAQS